VSLFVELNNLMVKYRFKPEKKSGQHFIKSESVLERIVKAAELKPEDIVLEIGPGSGFLTRKLLEKSNVLAIEIDEVLCELLRKEIKEKNFKLICGDYLKEKNLEYNKVVSFPPYFISKKIMQKILREKPDLCALVFQFEFASKLVALPGFRDYSALSVLAQYNYNIELAGRIQAKQFFPKPKSDSAIILMKKKKVNKKARNEEEFSRFIEEIFRHKNKNVANALRNSKKFLNKKEENLDEFIKKIKKREFGEKKVVLLDVEELVELFNEFS